MSTVDRIITKAWRKLPADVLEYEGFTNKVSEAPSSRVQKTILLTLLSHTAEGYRFSALHWRRKYELSEKVASAIAERIAGAGERLSAAVAWHRILLDEYAQWVNERGSTPADSAPEWLMGPSLALATRLGVPGDDAADQARAEMDGKAGPPGAPTAKDVQDYLRRNQRALNEALDLAWADGYHSGGDAGLDALSSKLDAFNDAAFTAQGDEWRAGGAGREAAVPGWEAIIAAARTGLGDSLVELSTASPPERPMLLGAATGKESRPLDRSIADRLSRMFKSPDVVVQPLDDDGPVDPPSFAETTTHAIVDDTIAASSVSYGLADPHARGLLLVMHRMTEHVAWQPDRRSRELALAEFSAPADQYFMRRWYRLGWTYREVAHPGTTLGRLLESPSALFIGRMWTRAARTQFQEVAWRPDARMAWEHATGIFRSVVKNGPSYYHYSQQTGRVIALDEAHGAEDDEEPGEDVDSVLDLESADRAFDTAVNQVLDVGRMNDGDDAVADFWFSIEDGDESRGEQWDRWVAACAGDAASYPSFDQVQQHALGRRDAGGDSDSRSRPPVLDDVLAITEFIGRGGTSRKARELLKRVAEEPEFDPGDRDAGVWDEWCERYIAHKRESGDEQPIVPTFAEMVILVRTGFDFSDGAGSE